MSDWQSPATAQAALRGLCPRCGAPGMFRGAVSFADHCARCGLDYSRYNVGDGPAAFLIFFVGGIVMLCAILMELNVHPPIWVHLILWLPLTVILTIGFLRLAKGMLLVLEHKNKAREGGLDQ